MEVLNKYLLTEWMNQCANASHAHVYILDIFYLHIFKVEAMSKEWDQYPFLYCQF